MINKSDLFVSQLLTNISLMYTNDNYISEKILPIVKVKKDTAQIATYWMDNLRVVDAVRAQWSPSKEVNHTVTIGEHYILIDHALKEFVTDEEVENADKPIIPKNDAVTNLMDRMWVIKEKALSTLMGNTSIITQNVTLSGTDQWNDYDNSSPIRDILDAIIQVRRGSGKRPNTIVIPDDVMNILLDHPDVLKMFPGKDVITGDDVMTKFQKRFPGIKNVLIGDAQFNSGVEWEADSLSEIWTKNFWILYVEAKPRTKSRSFWFTYQKGAPRQVKQLFRGEISDDREGQFVRVKDKYDQKLVDEKCGFLIKDAIA